MATIAQNTENSKKERKTMNENKIIWSNIKQVYYGNTKEDAADIGFRDDFIYKFLDKLNNNENDDEVLALYPCNRIVTMESFLEFKNKEDKTIY